MYYLVFLLIELLILLLLDLKKLNPVSTLSLDSQSKPTPDLSKLARPRYRLHFQACRHLARLYELPPPETYSQVFQASWDNSKVQCWIMTSYKTRLRMFTSSSLLCP